MVLACSMVWIDFLCQRVSGMDLLLLCCKRAGAVCGPWVFMVHCLANYSAACFQICAKLAECQSLRAFSTSSASMKWCVECTHSSVLLLAASCQGAAAQHMWQSATVRQACQVALALQVITCVVANVCWFGYYRRTGTFTCHVPARAPCSSEVS
jgi:hypothetical protein